jgi:hypothetical protein
VIWIGEQSFKTQENVEGGGGIKNDRGYQFMHMAKRARKQQKRLKSCLKQALDMFSKKMV